MSDSGETPPGGGYLVQRRNADHHGDYRRDHLLLDCRRQCLPGHAHAGAEDAADDRVFDVLRGVAAAGHIAQDVDRDAGQSPLIELSKTLQDRGVDLVVLDQGIDTSTAVGRMFFQILGAIAEFEHALMSERTRDGLAAARARGRTGGQKPKLGPRQVQLARAMYDELDETGKRRYTVAQIVAEFGVTRPTIYRHLSAAGATM